MFYEFHLNKNIFKAAVFKDTWPIETNFEENKDKRKLRNFL